MNKQDVLSDSPAAAERSEAVKQRVIFCDFDGTITENDNIIAIIKHFNPAGWEEIATDTIEQRMSIQEGVGKLFRLLPASMKEDVIRYSISNAVIRGGFRELLAYCQEEEIEFFVTSGGIDFFVYPLLEPFGIPQDHIYCNSADFSGDNIEILWPHTCDEHCPNGSCGMCKTAVIRQFSAERYERILIGDSVTDFEGAKLADQVYSRSHLTVKCRELGLPHHEFSTFHDVVDDLKERQQARKEGN
ncbi:2-hydroxy-3-keto-5-methylthiopentenyl-1-phosphate phosphatase [Paenibacillus pasadenensis]|uniref:2-hydroxy-3-keto-5-methylthiopentenyl-1- phosphate phosphatase n=1 Tax=Paenibacillus pasadenensis TaxID=217090 RepID=UPI00203FEF85|nr:2-hydroxy-3-keto-5-methylthiopentenyl-1-phosphate phosphatase [Paenibacillus pasadenensis]MCM3747533.1 2-hydroxy-3-keto-5-methylthiopentenyl-1-phosphate phosphatase [Paenibacillus pasadenensis]